MTDPRPEELCLGQRLSFPDPNGPRVRMGLSNFELLELEFEHGEQGPNRSLIESSPLS